MPPISKRTQMTTHTFTTARHDVAARCPPVARPHHSGIAHTVFGVAILAVLLFPMYWMLNVSLQPASGAVATPWLPTDITLHGYRRRSGDQGGHLLTSLEIALGTVVFSLLIAAPASYALAQLQDPRGERRAAGGPDQPDDPEHRRGQRAVRRTYSDLGLLNSVWGLIVADSTLAIPFAHR